MAASGLLAGVDDKWIQVKEAKTLPETALENKAPVVAAASTGDQPKVPQVEALDAGEAEALAPPVAAVAKQLQPVMETVGSVAKESEEQESQQVAAAESQQEAAVEETKAAESQQVVVIQSNNSTSQASNAAEAGMGTVVAAGAPSVNPCSILSSVTTSPIMPATCLWWQPLWSQMKLLQEGRVPGLTIGADPKELYICFV